MKMSGRKVKKALLTRKEMTNENESKNDVKLGCTLLCTCANLSLFELFLLPPCLASASFLQNMAGIRVVLLSSMRRENLVLYVGLRLDPAAVDRPMAGVL